MLLPFWSLWLAVAMLTRQGWTKVVHHFESPMSATETVFRHVIVDDSTGDVYVGGVNVLYKLSASLEHLAHVETGPKLDHLHCPPKPSLSCSVNYSRIAMDSINQALVIVPWQHLLIACDTLYYGYCEKFSLSNLTHVETVYAHVVPNDPRASVVMVVDSGDGNTGGSRPARLYVGATHSNIGLGEHNKVPMVSSRSIDTLMIKIESTASSFIDLLPQYRTDDFRVYFRAGFSHDTFTYFVIVRPKLVNGQPMYSTWLARVCHGDDRFQSYIEVPLECLVDNHNYTLAMAAHLARPNQHFPEFKQTGDALFVLFSTAEGNTAKTTTDAAVCTYSMGRVKVLFVQNIRECFRGDGIIGPAHLAPAQECTKANYVDFCGQHGVNSPIEGQHPIHASSVHPLTGHKVTSLAVKYVGQFTVALLGTDQGQLVKMVLWPSSGPLSANPVYDVVDIEAGVAIKSDLFLDSSDTHAYLLTNSKVHMVQLSDCSRHKSCSDCHAALDPHCGWCMLTNRCTLPTECAGSDVNHNWITFLSNGCPAISSLNPHMVDLSRFHDTKFVVNLRNVPLVVDQSGLECELQSTEQKISSITEAVTSDTVTCRPFISHIELSDKGFVKLEFSIVMNDTRVASKSVFVYQCSLLASCARCTETQFGCVWCPLDGGCVNNASLCTDNQDISSSPLCPWVSSLAGVGGLPTSGTKELLIPAGVSSAVNVIVINMQEQYAKNLKCRFALGGGLIVSANVSQPVTPESTRVTCQAVEFNFEENQPFKTVAVDVLWGDNKSLDSPNKTHVEIYKCDAMEDSCGQCLVLPPHFHCGWCVNHCSLKDRCRRVGWLDRSRICPNPQITIFSPVSGPVQGGTTITVNGTNLGKVIDDLAGGVTVAGVPCEVLPQNYVASMSFTCLTSAAACVTSDDGCVTSESGDAHTGGVKVVVNDTYKANSEQHFHYVIPTMSDFHPKKGPLAGKTRVTIRGEHLDTGSRAVVFVHNTSVTQFLSHNRTYLVFETPKVTKPVNASVHMVIDNQECRLDNKKFAYIIDPTITSVKPKEAIFKGGIRLTVRGTALDSVTEPKLMLRLSRGDVQVPCTVITSTEMHCVVPSLGIVQSNALYINFGFLMDGVTALANISTSQPNIGRMKLLPNPVAYPFVEDGRVREYDAEELVILGKNLNVLGLFPQTFHILVGSSPCNVTAFQTNQILCVPPRQPLHFGEDRKAEVVVTLGNFRADIGFLHYTEDSSSLPMLIILGIALGISVPLILILLFVLFICLRRHYSQTHKKPMVKLLPDAAGSLRPMYRYQQENSTSADRNGQEMVPLRSDEDRDHSEGQESSNACLSAVLDGIHDTILKRTIQEVLVPRERLEIGDVIGKGHFGCVYEARMRDAELGFAVKVAVKTLQGNNFNQEAIESFLAEGVIMKDFNHPHILRLLGMSIDERGNPMVILPYMANGDLRSYVKDKTRNFTARQLLRLAQQVAEGMAYLASLNFIHRDLAARNCMIDDVMTVKVADFGLARCLYQKEYYSSREHKGKMPIKWMALESLEDFVFTTKSDVWSFGVLLWELMTRCMTPYPDVDVFDIRNYLASGQRLRQPKYCPDSIYKIICECWHAKPEKRPSFIDLVNQLELLLNPPSKKRFPLDGSEPMYMNIRLESSDYLEPISTEDGDNGQKSDPII